MLASADSVWRGWQLRRVLDQIRGRSYEEALMILEYMPYRACEPILRTLISVSGCALSLLHCVVWQKCAACSCPSWLCKVCGVQAASNAKANMGMSKVKLYVSECYANGAGLYKRFKARAKGRCNLLVVCTCFLHSLCQAARHHAAYLALYTAS